MLLIEEIVLFYFPAAFKYFSSVTFLKPLKKYMKKISSRKSYQGKKILINETFDAII